MQLILLILFIISASTATYTHSSYIVSAVYTSTAASMHSAFFLSIAVINFTYISITNATNKILISIIYLRLIYILNILLLR